MLDADVVQTPALPLYRTASIGDTVTIRTPHGQERKGRVVMKFATHLVLNGGGKHGTPLVANDSNTIKVHKNGKKTWL